jgi:hypothetical protein
MEVLLEVILQFQLYVSSQFYPEWRATVADGTQRKPPPQIRTIVICAALGLQKADFGGRWSMCWRLLIPCFITTCVLVRTTALRHKRPLTPGRLSTALKSPVSF